jgi:predicted unusual protein kinase regulating ubiquinone biosynthesis (AarF/ABC1/UbiB family)
MEFVKVHCDNPHAFSDLPDILKQTFASAKQELAQLLSSSPMKEFFECMKDAGLKHEDFHPGNLMIDKKSNTYIIDF